MELTLKQYKTERVETKSKKVTLPTETQYFFETGIRRALRFTPIHATWEADKRIYRYKVTSVYLSFECKIIVESFHVDDIENLYYKSSNNQYALPIKEWVDGNLSVRSEAQFNGDLKAAFDTINNENEI